MSRPVGRGLLLVLLLSCVMRIAWLAVGPKVIESEGINYARLGENIAAGRGLIGLDGNLQLIYPPLIPGLVAVGVRVGLTSEMAGRLVSLLFGIWTPVIVYLLASRLYGAAAGWLAGVLAAVHPLLIVASTAVLSEATYLTLSLWVVLSAVGVLTLDSKRAAVLMGLAAGLAFLSRPEGIVLVVALAALIMIMSGRRMRMTAARLAIVLGIFAIFAAPWMMFLWQQTGQLRFETKSAQAITWQLGLEQGRPWQELMWGLDANLDEIGMANASDLGQFRLSQRQVAQLPLTRRAKISLKQVVHNVPNLLRGSGSAQFGQPMMAILVGLGLFGAAWNRERLRCEALLVTLVTLSMLYFLLWPWVLDRFLFILTGPLVIWAGPGLDGLGSWVRETADRLGWVRARSLPLGVGVLTVAVAVVTGASLIGVRNSDEMSLAWNSERRDQITVGRWLRSQAPGVRIVDSFLTAAHYAGDDLSDLPWTDSQTAVRYLEHRHPAFVILQASQLDSRPYLREWFGHVPDERMTLMKTFAGSAGQIRVYRWQDATFK